MADPPPVPSPQAYEAFFVPALFGQWGPPVAAAADIRPGDRVLDVACGTGALTRAVAARLGPGGSAVGLDINPAMIEVASRVCPGAEWRVGTAESLPFEDGDFDAVVSQFGLMFFQDRLAAIREMLRVLRPAGRVAVAVWGRLERDSGYGAVVALLDRLFGADVADELRAPFSLGDEPELRGLFQQAGAADVRVQTSSMPARFASIRDWIMTDVKAWTLGERLDDKQAETLVVEAEQELHKFASADGAVEFPMPAMIVTAASG